MSKQTSRDEKGTSGLARPGALRGRGGCTHGVAAQVKIESKIEVKLKAVYIRLVSSA
jgi:hypothetical protein